MGLILKDTNRPIIRSFPYNGATGKAGMLLEFQVDSGIQKVRAHSVAGGFANPVLVAAEQMNKDIETVFTDEDEVNVMTNPPKWQGILVTASGHNAVAPGTRLVSNGDGKLKIAKSGANAGLKVALVAGGVAGNHTVTGIALEDRLVAVLHVSTAASIATAADSTGDFTISAANTINNTGGDDTSSDQLWVFYEDRSLADPDDCVGVYSGEQGVAVDASAVEVRISVEAVR